MYINKKLKAQILEQWLPKVEARIKQSENGAALLERIPKKRLEAMAIMANTRLVYERKKKGKVFENAVGNATFQNTVGRSSFDFGNNPQNGYPEFYSQVGSGEVMVNLFSMFIESSAAAFGMDLLPIIPMLKSSLSIYIGEPVYAGGTLESAESKPELIQVKLAVTGTPGTPLNDAAIGTDFTIATDPTAPTSGEEVAVVTYVGRHRINGNAIFRIKTVNDNSGGGGTNWTESLVADLFDTAGSNAAIYTDGSNFIGFEVDSVDYVEGFTNYIAGYSGSGVDNTNPFFANRGNGKRYSQPMSRFTGSKTKYRSMGIRQWNRNFEAQTAKIDIELQTEQIQDMIMDHDMDANEFAETIITDQLAQHYNDHILGRMFALGWSHHYSLNQKNGFNLNAYLDSSANTGTAFEFLGQENQLLQIAGAPGVLPASGAISENLSSLQRRFITRMLYASGVINSRSRRGRGDQAVLNTKYSSVVKDIRGYREAEFENTIDSTTSVSNIGSVYGINVFEDNLMDDTDERVNVSRHGNEKDPGMKFCPYLLNERIATIAEGTMAPKIAMISRYALPETGSYPNLNYLTYVFEDGDGYALV